MTITPQNLHLFLITEVGLLNYLIVPLSLNNIKEMYSNYNMLGSYLIIVGLILLVGKIFKHFKPYIEKYHSKNKKIKLICDAFDINYDSKKIFKLKRADCLGYVFFYSAFILLFYPALFLANQLIIFIINFYKIIKPKVLKLYA